MEAIETLGLSCMKVTFDKILAAESRQEQHRIKFCVIFWKQKWPNDKSEAFDTIGQFSKTIDNHLYISIFRWPELGALLINSRIQNSIP